jgi:hypothetical protein
MNACYLQFFWRNITTCQGIEPWGSDTCSMPRTVLHPGDCWYPFPSCTKVVLTKSIDYFLDSLYILGPTICYPWAHNLLLLKYRNNTILVPTTKRGSDTCSMPRTVLHPGDCWYPFPSYTKVVLTKSIYYIFYIVCISLGPQFGCYWSIEMILY